MEIIYDRKWTDGNSNLSLRMLKKRVQESLDNIYKNKMTKSIIRNPSTNPEYT